MEAKNPEISVKSKKAEEPGIIYLSRIPTYMSVKKLRHMLEVHGEIGRVFLQPDERAPPKKKNRSFTEGWLEFTNKKVAKRVALTLNSSQVGGKRRSPWYDELWNMKYLPKFKWAHLNERLAYEREVHKQKLRTEIAQAKRETNFYIENVERKKILARKEKWKKKETTAENDADGEISERLWSFKQTEPENEAEIRKKRKLSVSGKSSPTKKTKGGCDNKADTKTSKPKRACDNKSFLKHMFSGGLNTSDTED